MNLIGGGLRGWAGDAKYWSVKKGVLTGITDGTLKANSFLTWKGSTIRNFDIRVQVRVQVQTQTHSRACMWVRSRWVWMSSSYA